MFILWGKDFFQIVSLERIISNGNQNTNSIKYLTIIGMWHRPSWNQSPTDIKLRWLPSPANNKAYYLDTTYSSIYLKSSLCYLQCLIQHKCYVNMSCLGNNDKTKSLTVQYKHNHRRLKNTQYTSSTAFHFVFHLMCYRSTTWKRTTENFIVWNFVQFMLLKFVTGGWSSSRMGKTDWSLISIQLNAVGSVFACSPVRSVLYMFAHFPVFSLLSTSLLVCLSFCLPVCSVSSVCLLVCLSRTSPSVFDTKTCVLSFKTVIARGSHPSPSTTPDSCREGGNKRRKAIIICLGFSLGLSWQQEQCVFGEKCSPCVIVLTSPPPLTVFMKNNFIFLFFCCRFDDSNLRW